ncbi:unnamed protein product [Bursaphelenchus okinawaensis]|uniref:protein disulfide-isomerase n=1 Tax=Bursaphelenchus okinawaensis TaxID=465554 RepID=A0A811LPV5_9BILA|nr:unnamed protein product [Bursaphelenchus okinawaensis]CAG9126686.1 unnamed protein product [Bursaphelenchus okinawaensis]
MKVSLILLGVICASVTALYEKRDEVIQLNDGNFKKEVLDYDGVVLVEFFAPWCGHCKNLVPEYKKAAKALKGLAKVAAVDATQAQGLASQYGVQGYPTIKVFGADKKKPTDHNGARTAQAFTDSALNEIRKIANKRLGGKSTSSGGSKSGGSKGGNAVVELTDANFDKIVLNSKVGVMVEFFAPWCGHCKNLEPHYKAAAAELKGKITFAALDATVHQGKASEYQIKGFPTIKYFPPGSSSASDAVDYQGGRTSSDLIAFASAQAAENLPPPELKQLVSKESFAEACENKQLCVITFLPQLLDCQSKCRKDYIKLLKGLADKFKKNPWGWLWSEAGVQGDIEQSVDVGGFGYPAMVAVNPRKLKYSTLTGSFGKDGISEFLRDLSFGRGKTSSIRGSALPDAQTIQAWDGKDAELPQEEEIDLSDVELDDLDEKTKTEL